MRLWSILGAALLFLAAPGAMKATAQTSPTPAVWRAGASVAFFGLTFIDSSTEGAYFPARDDQSARLEMLRGYVVDALRDKGFTLVDPAPVRVKLDRIVNPADCNGCAARFARELGAEFAVVGEVQKVSNLILSMNLVVRDAATGAFMRGLAVDIRGNTDDSWRRGMRYILRNNVFKNLEKTPQ